MEPPSPGAASPLALVTGGSRGIGAAICRRLARAGAPVLVAARSTDACAELAAELERDGGRAWPLALDVADPGAIRRAAAAVPELVREAGPVGWLVNNAGIAESAPVTAEDADAHNERHLRVNFHGARRVFEAFLPGMRATGYGRVVNVASSAGLRGYAYVSAYCASKFALVGYTLAAARELAGKGVALHAVCPHYVDSPMLDASVARLVALGKGEAEARAFFRAENPGGALVTPEQVADAVLELLTGAGTGRLLELDGSPEPREVTPRTGG